MAIVKDKPILKTFLPFKVYIINVRRINNMLKAQGLMASINAAVTVNKIKGKSLNVFSS